MNILLWALQVLAALLYGSSGVMKVFMFDKVSKDVPSFGALPREAWMALGILELVCTVGLIVPAAFRWNTALIALYQRLTANGKPHKLALIACARKLLIYANTVLQRGSPWTLHTTQT